MCTPIQPLNMSIGNFPPQILTDIVSVRVYLFSPRRPQLPTRDLRKILKFPKPLGTSTARAWWPPSAPPGAGQRLHDKGTGAQHPSRPNSLKTARPSSDPASSKSARRVPRIATRDGSKSASRVPGREVFRVFLRLIFPVFPV
jgi:hypothetical protein